MCGGRTSAGSACTGTSPSTPRSAWGGSPRGAWARPAQTLAGTPSPPPPRTAWPSPAPCTPRGRPWRTQRGPCSAGSRRSGRRARTSRGRTGPLPSPPRRRRKSPRPRWRRGRRIGQGRRPPSTPRCTAPRASPRRPCPTRPPRSPTAGPRMPPGGTRAPTRSTRIPAGTRASRCPPARSRRRTRRRLPPRPGQGTPIPRRWEPPGDPRRTWVRIASRRWSLTRRIPPRRRGRTWL
mmetsp:Transcript_5880/g.15081  ORF Transcript_5880/g.15081 Transcript_5880/m.15081 type:complete len:236 (-) Transcript_5880:429-1136(-)